MTLISKFLLILFLTFNFWRAQAWQELNFVKEIRDLPAKSSASHEKIRQQILRNMEKAMGKLPDRSNLPAFDIQIIDSVMENRFIRYTLSFVVAEKERLPVYLYVPKQRGSIQRIPAMLVLHGTSILGKGVVDGQGPLPNRAHARELAERGYVVIAPDYPSFGDLKDHNFDTDRYESATMQAIFNHMRCVDLLQSRPDVDPENIGVIGHSLGGHNAMFVAAFDNRLKVAVSSSGWTQFEYYYIGEEGSKKYGGRLGPWAQTRYMPLIRTKYKLDAKLIPFNFDDIITAIAPRVFFSVSPLKDANFDVNGVREGISLAEKVYNNLGVVNMLQVRYPDAGHDFPVENRKEVYGFLDRTLGHTPLYAPVK
ncbi:alpha/beta fold hydrolase [Daejeonella sp.]|uniref:alpha/beta fold hydrolase n=1 Tax=Daejeonella sp. TaxID=2805397 RepID=UPI002730649E|nr:alpha/beta fold hydrolase [Daejeonella sp.]MDP2415433.1 alpha/beta fold hydrolase [Daejeonella sp.]